MRMRFFLLAKMYLVTQSIFSLLIKHTFILQAYLALRQSQTQPWYITSLERSLFQFSTVLFCIISACKTTETTIVD